LPDFDLAAALPAAADAFRSAQRITAICHATPDADTIGGASAVALMARRLGKEAEIVSTDRPAPVFNFLTGIPEARTSPGLEPDLAVICDAATLERVGPIARDHAEWFSRARILNVDHHISNDGFGHINLVDPAAAATCQVLTRLVKELQVQLDAPLASALLTGIIRDSQGFSDKSTTSETLRVDLSEKPCESRMMPVSRAEASGASRGTASCLTRRVSTWQVAAACGSTRFTAPKPSLLM